MAQPTSTLDALLNADHEVPYGEAQQVSPLVRRITANNPGKFTFRGTGTYIVGQGKVAIVDPGPDDDAHIQALLHAVRGEEVTHILITHTHIDHSPATRAVKEATGAVVYAFGPHPSEPEEAASSATPSDGAKSSKQSLQSRSDQSEAIEKSAFDKSSSRNDSDQEGTQQGAALGGNPTSWAPQNNSDQEGTQREQPGEDDSEKSGDLEFSPDETILHGDVISVGDHSSSSTSDPAANWTFECLHTPGHISNHICFALREEEALFTGDHIMGWSSTVIPPPHGSLAEYLASLELLLPRYDQTYWPTHGPPISLNASSLSNNPPLSAISPAARPKSATSAVPSISPQTFAAALLQHRHDRTNQILACLADGPKTIDQLVAVIYADKPKDLHKPAAQSVKAHLIHLTETAQVREEIPTQEAAPLYYLNSS